jgi:hypothetical protein
VWIWSNVLRNADAERRQKKRLVKYT